MCFKMQTMFLFPKSNTEYQIVQKYRSIDKAIVEVELSIKKKMILIEEEYKLGVDVILSIDHGVDLNYSLIKQLMNSKLKKIKKFKNIVLN